MNTNTEPMTNDTKRAAGILMPIFSLPGRYGIGTLGKEAYRFADFLEKSGQTYWQVLPIGPTGYGDSPYQSFSTFAGNPYFIDLETLVAEGLLTKEECEEVDFGKDERRVDYEKLYFGRFPLLLKAYLRFCKKTEDGSTESARREREDYLAFLERSSSWLVAYDRFMTEKTGYPEAFYSFTQYEFEKQWKKLKAYVNEKGISIIGDIPIYVSGDSVDFTEHPELFQLGEDGKPCKVAGCPPDDFAAGGQLWGNPIYDWDYHKKTGYSWWISRMRRCFELFDVVRVDHFRGFDEYYAIPAGASDARGGTWEKGPGISLFNALKEALGPKPVIAEDLGYLTDSVRKLVRDTGYPGMKILEFAFDSRENSDYRPCTWPENAVCYTGTHDNQTLAAWFREISVEDQDFCARYCEAWQLGDGEEAGVKAVTRAEDVDRGVISRFLESDYVEKLIRLTLASKPDTAVIPLQDYLEMGAEARVNRPSTLGNNWVFRFREKDFSEETAGRIRRLTEESRRARKQ